MNLKILKTIGTLAAGCVIMRVIEKLVDQQRYSEGYEDGMRDCVNHILDNNPTFYIGKKATLGQLLCDCDYRNWFGTTDPNDIEFKDKEIFDITFWTKPIGSTFKL